MASKAGLAPERTAVVLRSLPLLSTSQVTYWSALPFCHATW